jgi:hypothetical protein
MPGHFEVDLVHHGGAEPRGDYVHTLQMIDAPIVESQSDWLRKRSLST